ncbi:MAG: hypothetical protein ACUVSX_13845 [Aggregatilineales bacterium]
MTTTFDHLKAKLEAESMLSDADIEQAIAEFGPLTPEELTTLEAERLKRTRHLAGGAVTLEQYLEATKVLDTAPEGSEEYQRALKIVETYEQGQ